MQDAIWAIYSHSIIGENKTLAYQHQFCPKGENSWCRYQRDVAYKTNNYTHGKCLPVVFCSEPKSLFTCLSDGDLLQRCLTGLTQNQNELINAVLWKKCPESVFCGKSKLLTGSAQAVLQWNQGVL